MLTGNSQTNFNSNNMNSLFCKKKNNSFYGEIKYNLPGTYNFQEQQIPSFILLSTSEMFVCFVCKHGKEIMNFACHF